MYERDQTATMAIKPCLRCGVGLLQESRFCRSCGARQANRLALLSAIAKGCGQSEFTRHSTTRFAERKLYHPVSGPLVSAVVAGVPASMPRSPASSLSKRVLLALMAIPIWVMIILMSPLDAYTSAKIIGSRI